MYTSRGILKHQTKVVYFFYFTNHFILKMDELGNV